MSANESEDKSPKKQQRARRPSARERVLKHMRGLAVGGAGASLALSSCACDPVPEPIVVDCANPNFDTIHVNATWDTEIPGPVVTGYFEHFASNLTYTEIVSVEGGTLRDRTISADYVRFEIVPAEDSTTLRMTIAVDCGEERHELTYVFDLSGTPVEYATVPVERE